MTKIYVLRLESGKWYVGKTSKDVKTRFKEHATGRGSAWTDLHKPVRIEKIIDNAGAFDEDKVTKEYMAKYGIDNVRGGSYVQPDLDEVQTYTVQKEIWAASDCCTNCGRHSHFVSRCYALTDVNGARIYDSDSDEDCSKETDESDEESLESIVEDEDNDEDDNGYEENEDVGGYSEDY